MTTDAFDITTHSLFGDNSDAFGAIDRSISYLYLVVLMLLALFLSLRMLFVVTGRLLLYGGTNVVAQNGRARKVSLGSEKRYSAEPHSEYICTVAIVVATTPTGSTDL